MTEIMTMVRKTTSKDRYKDEILLRMCQPHEHKHNYAFETFDKYTPIPEWLKEIQQTYFETKDKRFKRAEIVEGKQYINQYLCPANGWFIFEQINSLNLEQNKEKDRIKAFQYYHELASRSANRKKPKFITEQYGDWLENQRVVLKLVRISKNSVTKDKIIPGRTNPKTLNVMRLKRSERVLKAMNDHFMGRFYSQLALYHEKQNKTTEFDLFVAFLNYEKFIHTPYVKQFDITPLIKVWKAFEILYKSEEHKYYPLHS